MIALDTHAWVWWLTKPGKLGKKAARAIKGADRIGIPAICVWEAHWSPGTSASQAHVCYAASGTEQPLRAMKYQLYYYPGNANLAPHILLEEAGCEVELMLVDRAARAQKSPEYLRLNPNGRIPTLVCGDLVLFEAAAICVHVAEQYPEARLLPPLGALQRAHFFQWLMFLTNTVQPAFMAFRYPEHYTTDGAAHDGLRQRAAQQLGQAFAVLEAALQEGPFLLGRYSACDAYLLMLTWWAARRLPESPLRLPRLRACIEAVRERPATQRACRAEGIELTFQPL